MYCFQHSLAELRVAIRGVTQHRGFLFNMILSSFEIMIVYVKLLTSSLGP